MSVKRNVLPQINSKTNLKNAKVTVFILVFIVLCVT